MLLFETKHNQTLHNLDCFFVPLSLFLAKASLSKKRQKNDAQDHPRGKSKAKKEKEKTKPNKTKQTNKGNVEKLKSTYALATKLKIIKFSKALHDVKWKKKTIN